MEQNNNNSSSYTMDYENNEIILTIYSKVGKVSTRLTEKDVSGMKDWFELERHMKQSNQLFVKYTGL